MPVAILSQAEGASGDLAIERAGERLDDNEIDDFDLEVRFGIDDETGVCATLMYLKVTSFGRAIYRCLRSATFRTLSTDQAKRKCV